MDTMNSESLRNADCNINEKHDLHPVAYANANGAVSPLDDSYRRKSTLSDEYDSTEVETIKENGDNSIADTDSKTNVEAEGVTADPMAGNAANQLNEINLAMKNLNLVDSSDKAHLSEEAASSASDIKPASSASDVKPTEKSQPPVFTENVNDVQVHHVKWINWHGTKTPIVTQNENGPCPLLAIMNVLLLRGQVNLPDGLEVVSSQNLMERLGDCILRLTPSEFAHKPDYQQNISDAVAVLPKLMTGLDVNVKFTSVSEFEYTPECIVFDLLNIPLYHGWLVEPENRETTRAISSLSYNQLVERIIEFKGSGDSSKVSEALLAEQFLENSASQLTYHGLYELGRRLKDGELAVFFRNNHFSTMIKHKTDLFLLVTDQGFLNEKTVVWETLNNIEGDSKFMDAEFHLIPPKQEPLPILSANASPKEQIDHDMMVAMALEDREQRSVVAQPAEVVEECDRQLALQLQEEENRIAAQEATAASGSAERTPTATSPTESSGSKKKDKCTVL